MGDDRDCAGTSTGAGIGAGPDLVVPGAGTVIDLRGALSVAAGSAIAGVSGLVIMLLAANRLTLAENHDFLVSWSAVFAGYAILGGAQQESTRATGSAALTPSRTGARVLPVALGVGVGLVLVVDLTWRWWGARLLSTTPAALLGAAGGSLMLYAGHLAVIGALAGRCRWHASSVLIGAEAVGRLAFVGAALVLTAGLAWVELGVVLPAATWTVALGFGQIRAAAAARADVPVGRLVRHTVQAMAAAIGPAVLVVGFPAVLSAFTGLTTGYAPLFLSISLTRAALLMPLNAFQGAAITYFLDPDRPRLALLVRLVGALVVVALVLAVVAGFVGPWLLGLVNPAYVVSGWLLGTLTAAAAAMALLTLLGAVTLALGRHGAYAAGWLTATVAACGVLLVPVTIETRAVLALSIGPLVGAVVHVLAVRRDLGTPRRAAGLGGASGSV